MPESEATITPPPRPSEKPREDRPGRRRRALWWLARYGAPALLVVVAVVQVFEVERAELSPWKGGGFGMFSTIDTPHARFVRLELITDDGALPVPLPAALARAVKQIQAAPTPTRVKRLAHRLAGSTWAVPVIPRAESTDASVETETDGETVAPVDPEARLPWLAPMPIPIARTTPPPAGFRRLEIRGVHLQVWRYRFDPDGPRLEMELLQEARIPRPGPKIPTDA